MKVSRRSALQTLTALIGAALFDSKVQPTALPQTEICTSDRIVRSGETLRLPPGRYRRVILEGGRLEAPSDVCIEELVFHGGTIAMPIRIKPTV